ncbi:MAG: glycosyltransferase [Candidatus Peribacteria bacterium]|jgi:glycosyltransferase involved in cell wall biosynthesis|nr:glycosyltransferase [Candidatus Peribacteria bacterium]
MTRPLVSVVMPVFNTKKWLGEAVEGILSQTLNDFEFIIIDDCSTDGSYELLQEYAEKDHRIQLYRNEKNFGVAFTKSRAIALSTTDYLASQDSDDSSFPERLQLQYDFLEQHKDF